MAATGGRTDAGGVDAGRLNARESSQPQIAVGVHGKGAGSAGRVEVDLCSVGDAALRATMGVGVGVEAIPSAGAIDLGVGMGPC